MPLLRASASTALVREKNGAQGDGRSRGGPSTKIHALADALGNPYALMLTAGQDHDLACAEPLLEHANPGAIIADKAYDADALINKPMDHGVTPVIPPKANRKECGFSKLKRWWQDYRAEARAALAVVENVGAYAPNH